MKRLGKEEMARVQGGDIDGSFVCGAAVAVGSVFGPIGWFGAALVCIAATPSDLK